MLSCEVGRELEICLQKLFAFKIVVRDGNLKMGSPRVLVAIACLTAMFAGCEKQINTDVSSYNKTNIDRLKNAYKLYMNAHGMKGPKDEQELKNFLREDRAAIVRLKRMGVGQDEVDAMFISDRDGEPFVVRWGLKGFADHAMIFEAKGVDGKRLIALTEPREFDDRAYDDWLSGKTKPEKPNFSMEQGE